MADPTPRKLVEIYTDGGCDPNPGGPGGHAAILVYNGKEREVVGGYNSTTNNRMELLAAITGLESLKEPCDVRLCSDSKYVVDSMRLGWVAGWVKNGALASGKKANGDLWMRMLVACERHNVSFVWVKGHSGHHFNERCDVLAGLELLKPNLPDDLGFLARPAAKSDQGSKRRDDSAMLAF